MGMRVCTVAVAAAPPTWSARCELGIACAEATAVGAVCLSEVVAADRNKSVALGSVVD